MLLRLAGKLVLVAGVREAAIRDPAALLKALRAREELRGLAFQLLDAGLVAGPEHLALAALNALRAVELGFNVSSDLGLEALTFASGQRQISKAIELVGLKPGVMDVAVLLIGGSEGELRAALDVILSTLGGHRDDGVLAVDHGKAERLAKAFGISEAELSSCSRLGGLLEAIRALVLERVALSMAYR